METTIAIQGIQGSFHHQVAKQYFKGPIALAECMSFPEVVSRLKTQQATEGVMALENSIAGSIIPNYALIDQHDLTITGEYYLGISMNLMALKGQKIEAIQEVHSHPIALLQCQNFFNQFPHIKLVESPDTAETARRIEQQQLKGIGALAGPVAAQMYGLDILAANIHSIKNNTTRFVILKTKKEQATAIGINKASLKFELEDQQGSLAQILQEIHHLGLNLTKIQSMPIIENPWSYSFFVDVVFGTQEIFEKAQAVLALKTKQFKVLGVYKNGRL